MNNQPNINDMNAAFKEVHFIHPVEVVTMTQLLVLYAEKNLDAKKVNPKTDVTACGNLTQAFNMLVDNSEVEILRELFTPNEFYKYWSEYYMFICASIVACSGYDEFEEKAIPKVKFLFDIYQKVMKDRKIVYDDV